MEIRWMGNNTQAVNKLLEDFMARAEPDGPRLHLVGMGLNTHISVGDTIVLEGDRIGIRRAKPLPQLDKYVTWEGDNLLEIDDFLRVYGVRLQVMNERLAVITEFTNETIASLGRGDRITKAGSEIVVTRAGQHHRT